MDETNGRPIDDPKSLGPQSDAGEDQTRVIAGEEATRVMGGATQAAAPPPPPIQPRLVKARPSGPRRWWWLIVLVALLLAAALPAIWYLLDSGGDTPAPSPSPSPASFAWAGAWSRTDGSGGGLVIEGDDRAYTITAYDETLRTSASAAAKPSGDVSELSFTLSAAVSFGAAGELTRGTLAPGEEATTATLSVVRDDGSSLTVPLRRIAALTASRPSARPSPSSASPSASPSAEARRQQMIAAVESIQRGVEKWATANGGLYPAPADVRAGSAVAAYIVPWPVNPYALGQEPMTPGTAAGEYTYEQLDGGAAYALTGYLDNGTFVVP